MNNKLNISIVLYNNPQQQLINLLNDILASNNLILNKIFLVDNSPHDKLANLQQLAPDKIEYISAHHNPGYGTAHNIAIKSSMRNQISYHLVVNPDIRFNNETLAKLISLMTENNNIGLVMPKVTYPNGNTQYLCKLLPTPFNIFARRFMPQKYIDKMNYQYTMQFTNYEKLMPVPYLSGSFMLFRVKDLAELGSFDEQFFMYFEDTDITRRFYQHGKAWFYPDVAVIHEHNQESYRSLKMFWVHIQNMVRYFNKYGWFEDYDRQKINYQLCKNYKVK